MTRRLVNILDRAPAPGSPVTDPAARTVVAKVIRAAPLGAARTVVEDGGVERECVMWWDGPNLHAVFEDDGSHVVYENAETEALEMSVT